VNASDVNVGGLRRWSLLGGLVILYFAAGKLGLHFAFVHSSATAVWPPTGIAIAAVLLFGYRVAPAIFVGAFLVNITTTGSVPSSLGIAFGNTLEAVAAGFLVTRFAGGPATFSRARDILRFSVLAGLVSTTISATIGVTSLVLTGSADSSQFGAIWLTWWLGDAAGALIVTPLLVLWLTTRSLGPLGERPAESILLLLVVVATGALVFMYPALSTYPLPFLCIPALVWAAFRFGQREVATGVAILSAIAAWATVSGSGPFVMRSENESLLLLQAFMATIAALTLPVAALVWERKAVEQERAVLLDRERAARAEAEAANHAKDEFLAMLSHELRNPLAAIGNAAQVLVGFEKDEFAYRAVEIIERQTRHLSRLIDDLLDVARVMAGKIVLTRERVNLADAVERSVAVIVGTGQLQGHQTEVELEPVWVNADPARLSQVVENLLINAIKYTPARGLIRIQTRVDGDEAVLRVQDSGMGIAPELLPRVFELFTQGQRSLDRAQGGLGIGLALVRRLVELHGGRVAAYSEGPSKGSAFVVCLPRADARRTDDVAADAVAARPMSRKRIVIIEDDADGREALCMQLLMAGHEVHEAKDGKSGIEVVQRVRPDVVLLDIGLPGLDGYEVARRLKSRHDCPRLVAVTGYGRSEDKDRAKTAGFDAHLTKPVEPDELHRMLHASN
jgi:signal transduction histidine kinase/CheY-like chemotaxis protein